MKVLIAPLHILLDKEYGSEYAWATNLVLNLANKYPNIRIYAIVGESRLTDRDLPTNLKLYSLHLKSLAGKRLLLETLSSLIVLSNIVRKKVDIVHHMFPCCPLFGFSSSVFIAKLTKLTSVLGPLQFPQIRIYSSDKYYLYQSKILTDSDIILTKLIDYYSKRLFIKKTLLKMHNVIIKHAYALIFDSKTTLSLYRRVFPEVDFKNVFVLPPGVDDYFFSAYTKRSRRSEDNIRILCVGPLISRKGYHIVIKALKILRDQHSINKGYELVIVGHGPLLLALKELVWRWGLESRVIFKGYVRREELVHIYADSHIYVHPSLSDTFPSSLREAMASGCAVIATCVGFIPEHIRHGENGLLVRPGNPKDIAEYLAMLIADDRLRRRLGDSAYAYAKRVFSYHSLAEGLYNIYKALLK